jgi:hypothetical protein
MTTPRVLLALLLACTPVAKPEATPDTPAAPRAPPVDPLAQLLNDRGLTYEPPPGYRVLDIPTSDRWPHAHAIASTAMDLEIRLGAAPPAVDERLRAACNADARCLVAPSKAALEGILAASVERLAASGTTPRIQEFPLDAVRHEFNAHWGGAVSFEADPAFARHEQGLAIVIHREGRGTAMIVTTYPEVTDAFEDERMRAFHALRFADPFVASDPARATLAGTRWTCGDAGFNYLRFEPTTMSRTTLSAAMAVMGKRTPYETEYAEVTYLEGDRVAATTFRIDNMEQGDRTPKTPIPITYTAKQKDDTLTFTAPDWPEPWTCTLVTRR